MERIMIFVKYNGNKTRKKEKKGNTEASIQV